MNPSVRLAAMDLDGTLLAGQSQQLLTRFFVRRRVAPASLLWQVAAIYVLYRLGWKLDLAKLQRRVVRTFAGLDMDRLDRLYDEFVAAELMPRLRRDGRDELAALAGAEAKVILISAAIAPLVERVGSRIGAACAIGTRLAAPDGPRFAGEVEGTMLSGPAKAASFRDRADEMFGRGGWRLWRAYGDHDTDVDLLAMADEPVAVCPTPRLQAIAQSRGWKTVTWQ